MSEVCWEVTFGGRTLAKGKPNGEFQIMIGGASLPGMHRRRTDILLFAVTLIAGIAVSLFFRRSAFFGQFIFVDDFVHAPYYHLLLYRPIQAVELYVMQQVFGDKYLLTIFPKVVANLYLCMNASLIFVVVRRWGAPIIVSIVLSYIYVFNPIISDFLLWNSLTSAQLGVTAAILSFLSLASNIRFRLPLAAVLAFCCVATYPPCIGVLLSLILFEAAVKRAADLKDMRFLTEAFSCIFAAAVAFFIYKMSQDLFLAGKFVVPPGPRQFVTFSDLRDPGYWTRKHAEVLNQYVNLVLPSFSTLLDTHIAGKLSIRFIALLFLLPTAAIIISRHKNSSKILVIVYFTAGFLSPMLYNFLVNWSSLSIRVAISHVPMAVFSLAIAVHFARRTTIAKPLTVLATIVGAAFVALSVPSIHTDARLRADGWNATNHALEELAAARGRNTVISLPNPNPAAEASYRNDSYMVSYQPQSCRDFSASYYFEGLYYERSRLLTEFLEADHFTDEELDLLKEDCIDAAKQQVCGVSVVIMPERDVNALCVYSPP